MSAKNNRDRLDELVRQARWLECLALLLDTARERCIREEIEEVNLLARGMSAMEKEFADEDIKTGERADRERAIWRSASRLITRLTEEPTAAGAEIKTPPATSATNRASAEAEAAPPSTVMKEVSKKTERLAEKITSRRRFEVYDEFSAMVAAGNGCAFECSGLEKSHQRNAFFRLKDVSFRMKTGKITAVAGLNGSGKTTLLRIIAGELLPDRGTYSYPMFGGENKDWFRIRRGIAYVSQSPPAWKGRLMDYLLHAAAMAGVAMHNIHLWVDHILARLQLQPYREYPHGALSSGYRMRAELARAMTTLCPLVVLDEPLSPLDLLARQSFLCQLADLAASVEHPLSFILSTLHQEEVEAFAHQMLVIGHDGALMFAGPPWNLGAGRSYNLFEVTLSRSLEELFTALTGLDASIAHPGGRIFLIRLPLSRSGSILAERLVGPSLAAVRDLTLSTSALLVGEDSTLLWHPVP